MFSSNQELIRHLSKTGILKSEKIRKALLAVDRKNFVPQEQSDLAYADNALPFADGQTISQPTTVVFMLELLGAKHGHKALDVGAGTGWVSCLLGEIVGKDGKVYAFEVNEKMGEIGLKNIEKYGCENVSFRIADAAKHWDSHARYDRIHAAAAFEQIPEDLLRQLKVDGILVAPTQDGNMWKITRKKKDEFIRENHYGFAFVPFV